MRLPRFGMRLPLFLVLLAAVRAGARSYNGAERRPLNEVYHTTWKNDPWVSWNRLLECDPQEVWGLGYKSATDDNSGLSMGYTDMTFNCDNADTRTSNLTVHTTYTGNCTNYKRRCTMGDSAPIVECSEDYEDCTITNTNYIPNLNATGIAPEVIAECIPAIGALRDGCNVTMGYCKTEFKYEGTSSLLECLIDCVDVNIMCQNYTRNCSKEVTEVVNVGGERTVKIIALETECEYTTNERHVTQEARWNDTKFIDDLKIEHPGKTYLKQVATQIVWDKEKSWENCVENTQVFYKPVCNYFIANIMDPLKDVVFDPNAHNVTEGIKMFLSQWDEGWHELCNEHCFLHLVKFSRGCWPLIPLQRFMPNADYQTVERFLRNVSRIACYNIGPPTVKYSSDLEFLDSRNSCLAFFDNNHNLTKVFYENITRHCDESDVGMCNNTECIGALDGIAERFGCCIGSILYSYKEYSDWLALFNFNNHPILRRMVQCQTNTSVECENQFMIVIMSISFYWQLEHEPIKKACLAFFDNNHNLTKVFYENITRHCDESDVGMCNNTECIGALDGIAERFGCCIGSILYSYKEYSDWLALFNFNNHPILRRMVQCQTNTSVECENQFVTSIVVTIVQNFIYVLGGIMGFMIVIMSISFYWQLEHEPIKKAFYHFRRKGRLLIYQLVTWTPVDRRGRESKVKSTLICRSITSATDYDSYESVWSEIDSRNERDMEHWRVLKDELCASVDCSCLRVNQGMIDMCSQSVSMTIICQASPRPLSS
eukprot:sb/3479694/